MKTKKLASLFLASAMILSLSACGKDAGADVSGGKGYAKADVDVQSEFDTQVDTAFLTVIKPDELSAGTMSDADVAETKEKIIEKLVAENGCKDEEELNTVFKSEMTEKDYTESLNKVEAAESANLYKDVPMTFSFNNNSVSYPFSLSTFEDMGWEITEYGKEYSLIDKCSRCDFSYTKGDFAESSSSLQLFGHNSESYNNAGNYSYLLNNGVYGFEYTCNDNFDDYLHFSINDFSVIGNSYSALKQLCEDNGWIYYESSDGGMVLTCQSMTYVDNNDESLNKDYIVTLFINHQNDKINSIQLSCRG